MTIATWNYKTWTSKLYVLALIVVAVGLPLSMALMSIGGIGLGLMWFLSGGFKAKFQRLNNPHMWMLSGIYVLHVIGLLYTADMDYALKDLRIKLPLFFMPIVLATMPLPSKHTVRLVLGFFIWATVAGSLISCLVLLGFIPGKNGEYTARAASLFISHIRFALMLVVAVALLYKFKWFTLIGKGSGFLRWLLFGWLLLFLFLFQSATGMVLVLVLTLLEVLKKLIWDRGKGGKFKLIALLLPFLGVGLYLFSLTQQYYASKIGVERLLEQQTLNGNPYTHDTESVEVENGEYIWRYICWKELKQEWKKRSSVPFQGEDQKAQALKATLIRYMTSKGLKKDSAGLASMSDDDVMQVERGIATVRRLESGPVQRRLEELLHDLEMHEKEANKVYGSSMALRFEYWKGAVKIWKENLLFGVGTGDIRDAFEQYYQKESNRVGKGFEARAHNQYLTFFATFGLFGGTCFIIVLFWLFFQTGKHSPFLKVFLVIFMLSCLTEDTLETQAGVTFSAFFLSVFAFYGKQLLMPLDQK